MSFRKESIHLYNNGLYQDALEMLLSEDVNPLEDPDLAYLMGLCHTRLEDYQSAIFYLEKSLEGSNPLLFGYQVRIILGFVYNQIGNYKAAEEQLRKLLSQSFESCQIYSSLGYALWRQKRISESIDFFSRALELDKGNPNTLNSLGYVLADEGINPGKAVAYCSKALAFKPDNGNYMDSLGWALFRTGRIREGREYLEKALNAGGDMKVCKEHLKQIYEYEKKNS